MEGNSLGKMPESNPDSDQSQNCKTAKYIPIYIVIYTLFTIWLTIDGFVNNFGFLQWFWGSSDTSFSQNIIFLLFTMCGSLMGVSLLGIISFHRYYAIEHSFKKEHLWGFLLSPFLGLIVGILIYSILKSGMIVLSGQSEEITDPTNAYLGYLAIGAVAGYNWDVFVRKIQQLSRNILDTSKSE